MTGLSVEDFKNVLLDLYLAQRELATLRAQLAVHESPGEESDGHHDRRLHNPGDGETGP